jgi:hypothetical protein
MTTALGSPALREISLAFLASMIGLDAAPAVLLAPRLQS